jgi:hypothetical protein
MGADVPCLIILLLPSSKTMPTANLLEIGAPQNFDQQDR